MNLVFLIPLWAAMGAMIILPLADTVCRAPKWKAAIVVLLSGPIIWGIILFGGLQDLIERFLDS